MYVFGFGDKLSQEAFYYMLSNYQPAIIAFHEMDDSINQTAIHQALFKVLKGATLLVFVANDTIELRTKDWHQITQYSEVNTTDVHKWLDERALKKASGNSNSVFKQIAEEREKIYPILKEQAEKNRIAQEKEQEERIKQLQTEQAERRNIDLEWVRQQGIWIKENNPNYWKTTWGEKIQKEYPELYDEYKKEKESYRTPWW
jgi:hypothetical protein